MKGELAGSNSMSRGLRRATLLPLANCLRWCTFSDDCQDMYSYFSADTKNFATRAVAWFQLCVWCCFVLFFSFCVSIIKLFILDF